MGMRVVTESKYQLACYDSFRKRHYTDANATIS
jgi:hypothetical protein